MIVIVFFKYEHIYIILSTDDRQPAGDSRVTGEKANGGYTSCRNNRSTLCGRPIVDWRLNAGMYPFWKWAGFLYCLWSFE